MTSSFLRGQVRRIPYFHEAITLSPTPSAPLGPQHPAQRGTATQNVLYFRSCIERQYRTYIGRRIFIHHPLISCALSS